VVGGGLWGVGARGRTLAERGSAKKVSERGSAKKGREGFRPTPPFHFLYPQPRLVRPCFFFLRSHLAPLSPFPRPGHSLEARRGHLINRPRRGRELSCGEGYLFGTARAQAHAGSEGNRHSPPPCFCSRPPARTHLAPLNTPSSRSGQPTYLPTPRTDGCAEAYTRPPARPLSTSSAARSLGALPLLSPLPSPHVPPRPQQRRAPQWG
jgi:hypothetical protein